MGVKGSAQVMEQLDNPLNPFIPLFMYVLCILFHFVPSRCLTNVTSPAPVFLSYRPFRLGEVVSGCPLMRLISGEKFFDLPTPPLPVASE